jgi:DNA-binding transcriptional ArsR family regulator
VSWKTNLAAVATLVAEPTRATILDALMAGEPLASGELARRAEIAPSTASGHLARLLEGGLVTYQTCGCERRYQLASLEVAEALESLARVARPPSIRSLRAADRERALRLARLCYDHLAGQLGVALTDALVEGSLIGPGDGTFALTARGDERLRAIGVDLDRARTMRRPFARACLDWSERRPHLAGALGAVIADALLAQRLIVRRAHDRAVMVTPQGRATLHELGVELPPDDRTHPVRRHQWCAA